MTYQVTLPAWTQPPPLSKGRDHLGMQAPSITLYGSLVPNITNVTRRVRYYSFYPWLCDNYARRKGDTSAKSWQYYVRKAEALLALSSCANADGTVEGVAGIIWANRHWNSHSKDPAIDFEKAAVPGVPGGYLKAKYGAFGQIYQSALNDLGLLGTAQGHSLPVPGIKIGDDIVKAYSTSVMDVGEDFLDLLDEDEADSDTLRRIGKAFSPSAIPEESDERQLLQKILFGEDRISILDTTSRRKSLLLFLHLADCLKAKPNVNEIRWALYSQRLADGKPFTIPSQLSSHAGMWQAYQANELAHIAMEALLSLLLEGLNEHPVEVTAAITETVNKVLSTWEKLPVSWSVLRGKQPLTPNSSDLKEEGSEVSLAHKVMDRGDLVAAAAAGVQLLAVLDNRWPGLNHPVGSVFGPISTLGKRFPHSVMGLLSFLRARENLTFEQTLFDLVQRYVVEQHLRIAMRKLYHQGKRTFLFELLDGQLQKPLTTSPVFTNPRIETSLLFLRDLYLLDEEGLSARGKNLLGAA